mgnify:CR=1 FL=1
MYEINAIIIDDELNSIKTLKWELDNLDLPVNIVEQFTDVSNAISFLSYHAHTIDLVFLDIQMPEMNGFEFLDKFTSRTFDVIFVTAYDEYALQAIKKSAIDYILKPVEEEELKLALKKIIFKQKQDKPKQTDNKKVAIPLENKFVFLEPNDIIYCKSDGNYTVIHTIHKKLMISKTLKFVEELLPKSIFYRIHQSYIINLKNIEAYDRSTNYVKLSNNKELPVSRSKRTHFLEQL